jgi:DNA repair exonuclease SbcCD ATPase subunit
LFGGGAFIWPAPATALSAGFGWKHLASEISYGIAVPLTGAVSPAHSLTLALRFGDRDVESEYERLIRQEIKYRKDLVEALDESAKRENLLKGELASMKAETDSLAARLKETQQQKATVKNEAARLEAVVRRQAAAEAELKALAEKRAADKLNQLKYDFSVDWQGYLKLKGGGAPADVLKGTLQRMVSQYQDSGIDISQATVELQGLVR